MLMPFSRLLFLMAFGSESGWSGLENEAFCKDVLQKACFAEVGILMIPGSISYDFEEHWDKFS